MDFLETKKLTFYYETEEGIIHSPILNNLNIQVRQGEFVALLGHNGCGKSTVAKHFNALLLPVGGHVYVDGLDTLEEKDLYKIRRKVGLVLQNPDNQLVSMIVENDVAFGLENLGIPPKDIRVRVDKILKTLDMYEYRMHASHKLSGGQKQRIAIAGILAMQPSCIVLDEPTAMLDPQGRDEVMNTILDLNQKHNITVVLITHYMEEAVLADRVIVMNHGSVLKEGTLREVFSEVELLKKHDLDVPQASELIYRLQCAGFDLPNGILNAEECVSALENLLSISSPI